MGSGTIQQLGSRQFCAECGRPFAPDDLVRFGAVAVCADCKPVYVQRMREGVAAPNAFVYAGFWRRYVAVLIDAILLLVVLYPIRILMATPQLAPQLNQSPFTALWGVFVKSFWSLETLIAYVVEIIYYVYFISQKGATLGKMLMGVKVVTANGQPVSVARATGRYFAHLLSWLIFCIGYIIAAFDDQKRTLHDYMCNTRVIRD